MDINKGRWGLKKVLLIVGILLNLTTSAFAAPNTVDWRKFSYFQNWGGLNDQQSTIEVADNEATDIQNIIFDTGGALKKRFGYTTLVNNADVKVATGTVVAVTGLTMYKLDSGTKYLVSIANNDSKATAMSKTYDANGDLDSVAPWDNIDFAGLPSGYANTNLCDFAVARDALVFTVGLNTVEPFKWTGTGKVQALTSDTDCPNASIVEYHKNQLFLAGNDSWPSRVYFSEIDSITSFVSTDFFDVETSDGTQVRSLLSAYDALYIFKDSSIWRLSGYERDSFRLEKMIDGVGTLSNQSPVATNSGIYFISAQNDVFHYDGAYTVTQVSEKINGTVSGLDRTKAQYALGLAYSTYRFVDTDYYAAVTLQAALTNNRILLYDTNYKAWTIFKGFTPLSWCVADDNDGKSAIFFGDYDGYVHQYPSTGYYDGNIATSAIAALYQTKWFQYSDICLGDKYWRLLKTFALSADDTFLHAECRADYEASGKVIDINLESSQSNWDVALWDVGLWGGSTVIIGHDEINKGTNMFQIEYYNEDVDKGFTLLGFSIFVEPAGRI